MRYHFTGLLLILAIGGVFAEMRHHHKRQALPNVEKWPNNTMSYYYEDNFPLEMQAMFRDAFKYLGSHSCLSFKHDEKAENAVRIELGDLCLSQLGRENGHQSLSFGYSCAAFGVALHEVMHALGIAHSQSRSDRDQYMVVNSFNHNDDVKNTINSVPFDYGSVMLYWRDEYRWPLDPEYNYTMGSLRVAFYDMILLNDFYGCNCNNHPIKLDCKNGGYQNPSNCDQCLCTDGFKGQLCDELEGTVAVATTEWNFAHTRSHEKKGIDRNTMPLTKYIHVTAPEGSIIEVKIKQLDGFYCHMTCDYNGVELKYKTDRRIVSPLVCCNNDNLWNTTRSSTNNPFVIVLYGDERTPVFNVQFRYVPENSTASAESKKI